VGKTLSEKAARLGRGAKRPRKGAEKNNPEKLRWLLKPKRTKLIVTNETNL